MSINDFRDGLLSVLRQAWYRPSWVRELVVVLNDLHREHFGSTPGEPFAWVVVSESGQLEVHFAPLERGAGIGRAQFLAWDRRGEGFVGGNALREQAQTPEEAAELICTALTA